MEEPGPVNLEMPIVSPSKRKQPLEQKGEEKQPSEGGENSGTRSKSSANGKGRVSIFELLVGLLKLRKEVGCTLRGALTAHLITNCECVCVCLLFG